MTTDDRHDSMDNDWISAQDDRTTPDGARDSVTASPAAAARALAHLRGRARSHPDAPATGYCTMSEAEWRACIAHLRRRGYRITEAIVTPGDRAANEIGYTPADEQPSRSVHPSTGLPRPVAPRLAGRPADRRSVAI